MNLIIKYSRISRVCLTYLFGCFLVSTACSQVPGLLHYQGRVLSAGNALDGNGLFKFALLNADGTNAFWLSSSDLNADGEPDSAVLLPLSKGLYSVMLGDTGVVNMASMSPALFTNNALFLRVWFNDGTNGYQQMRPDQRVTSVGYAMIASTVPDGSINSNKLAPEVLNLTNLTGVLSPQQIPNLSASKITSGIFANTLIPGLSASWITSGRLSPSRLPLNVAYTDTDIAALNTQILNLSNRVSILSSNTGTDLTAMNTAINAQILNLSNWVSVLNSNSATFAVGSSNALLSQLLSFSNQVANMSLNSFAGYVLASILPQDTNLLAKGLVPFMTMNPPGWTAASTTDAPTARYGHSAVWTGNDMIVWGGNLGSGILSDRGAMYTAASDQWRAVSTVHTNVARNLHTAVWTGYEMLMWGGVAGSSYLNTGGRFQPGLQLWSSLTTASAPDGRSGHVAAWTGTKMFIWGGKNSTGLLDTGAVYDPTNNAWQAVNLPGTPIAREGATVVCTGNRLLIWGGDGGSSFLDSGAQLVLDSSGNPTSWQAMSTLNAPSARKGHAAVWTGQQMLIWGGFDGSAYLANGAAYDPISNIWTSITTSNAPSARSSHSVVWTGQEMLIWGGETASGAEATGAAYAPATDSWYRLSSSGNPTARSSSPAVWTGTELVVFGGKASNGTPLAAPQKLVPQPVWYLYRKP